MADRKFLDSVYALDGVDATRALYSNWAASYDAEVGENGYVTPRRCAEALAAAVSGTDSRAQRGAQEDADGGLGAPLLDIGCGTGLSGLAFAAAGFSTMDGSDLTEEMLGKARARGVYRRVWLADMNDDAPFEAGQYTHAAAVGLISPGHAPAGLIDAVMGALPSGGCFVFSLNDHALADPSFEGRVREQADTGAAQVMFREHGDHLPGIGLASTVYVLRKR
ncbi:MAG: methyltransferase domain-containing protein [Pseudomonadota bacterium]